MAESIREIGGLIDPLAVVHDEYLLEMGKGEAIHSFLGPTAAKRLLAN